MHYTQFRFYVLASLLIVVCAILLAPLTVEAVGGNPVVPGGYVLETDGALESYETVCASGGTRVENADGTGQDMETRLYRVCAAVETVWVCDGDNVGACGGTDGWPIMAGTCDYIRIGGGAVWCRSGTAGVFYANAAGTKLGDLN